MEYLLLVVEPRGQRGERSQSEGEAAYAEMVRFANDLSARGVLKASNSLRSDTNGTRVSTRAGKQVLTDGPFAEAREMIGGFFLIDCASRQEAIAIAGKCPAAAFATIEVREVGPCYT